MNLNHIVKTTKQGHFAKYVWNELKAKRNNFGRHFEIFLSFISKIKDENSSLDDTCKSLADLLFECMIVEVTVVNVLMCVQINGVWSLRGLITVSVWPHRDITTLPLEVKDGTALQNELSVRLLWEEIWWKVWTKDNYRSVKRTKCLFKHYLIKVTYNTDMYNNINKTSQFIDFFSYRNL